MKKYLKFISEDLQQVKDDMAEEVAANEDENSNTKESDKQAEEIEQKSNQEIGATIEDTVKKFEEKKGIINKQIEVYNDQIGMTQDKGVVKGLEQKVKDLETQLLQFDDMIKNSNKQVSSLVDKQKQQTM